MNNDIIETAAAAGTFRTLAAALREADLVNTLKGAGPYTVFAPTDAAFAKLPKAEIDSLLKDKEKLKGILLFHVLPGKLSAAAVGKMHDGDKMKTVSGKEFTLGLAFGDSVRAGFLLLGLLGGLLAVGASRVIQPKTAHA